MYNNNKFLLRTGFTREESSMLEGDPRSIGIYVRPQQWAVETAPEHQISSDDLNAFMDAELPEAPPAATS